MPTTPSLVIWPQAPLTESLVLNALNAIDIPFTHLPSLSALTPQLDGPLLQWSTYDHLNHDLTHLHRDKVLSSSYTFRKALIRKHYLSRIINSYTTKHPTTILKEACPKTYEIELSFTDELDEMWTDELWELGEALDTNSSWWILKPGMTDRGVGIRLFHSKEGLRQIFEDFENKENDEDDDSGIITSQLRHFVVQEYILQPLLLDPSEVSISGTKESSNDNLSGYKFHLRAYCVAKGALQLFLYTRILALFSAVGYSTPEPCNEEEEEYTPLDLKPHLTNTSLQTHRGEEGVRLLTELIGCHILSGNEKKEFTSKDVEDLIQQMRVILAETFKAAIQNPIHFQPLPNAFELYGVDFLVSHDTSGEISKLQLKILEINAEPAIELTGPRLTWILEELFLSTAEICVKPFFSGETTGIGQSEGGRWPVGEERNNMLKCLDEKIRGYEIA